MVVAIARLKEAGKRNLRAALAQLREQAGPRKKPGRKRGQKAAGEANVEAAPADAPAAE